MYSLGYSWGAMRWLKKILEPSLPREVKIVARFQGRLDGEGDPCGVAVSGDYVRGEAENIMAMVLLADGSTLADRLAAENIPEMDTWIQGQHEDPVPRALLRLLADAVTRGEELATQEAIVFFWMPGRPPKRIYDGPATLAQILGLRIKMFYTDSQTDQNMVVDFSP